MQPPPPPSQRPRAPLAHVRPPATLARTHGTLSAAGARGARASRRERSVSRAVSRIAEVGLGGGLCPWWEIGVGALREWRGWGAHVMLLHLFREVGRPAPLDADHLFHPPQTRLHLPGKRCQSRKVHVSEHPARQSPPASHSPLCENLFHTWLPSQRKRLVLGKGFACTYTVYTSIAQ